MQNVAASRKSNGSPTYINYDGLIVLDPNQAASISLESLEAEHLWVFFAFVGLADLSARKHQAFAPKWKRLALIVGECSHHR